MSSIFTMIINREIPAYIVAEDDNHIAFLDINPVAMGHTLVVPKVEVDYIFDLDDADYQALHAFAARLARSLQNVVPCKRIGTAVVGLEVPHVHIHLIPLNSMQDFSFSKPKLKLSKEELSATATQIKAVFDSK
ncbi:MAG: HIT family protein [Cyclobacteriaceae bacterium]